MKREYKLYLQDIRDCIAKIEKYIQGVSEDTFNKNILLQDGVIRRLEIMGGASRNIPKSLKEKNKQVSWFTMSQFRDLIAHSYYDISIHRVWNIIKNDIPKIKEAMKNIVLV